MQIHLVCQYSTVKQKRCIVTWLKQQWEIDHSYYANFNKSDEFRSCVSNLSHPGTSRLDIMYIACLVRVQRLVLLMHGRHQIRDDTSRYVHRSAALLHGHHQI